MTLEAIQYVFNNQLPGHAARYVLRTNLSSFWFFPGLAAWLQDMPQQQFVSAMVGQHKTQKFPSGAGTLMSRDVAKLLLDRKHELD